MHTELCCCSTTCLCSLASSQYQDVNGTVLMYRIHSAAWCALDGEVLLKQACETAVDGL